MMENTDWPQVYNELKKRHDEAYYAIENGIKLEEQGNFSEAISQYEVGLVILDKALSVPIECPSNPDINWEKACAMVHKMKKTKKEVLCRIADVQTTHDASAAPPSYEEAISNPNTPLSPRSLITYSELGIALENLKIDTGAESAHLLYTHENVRLYFISPDGSVTATSEPDTLRIAQLEDEDVVNRPRAFLQIGDWIYPLVPGVSPCFRTEYGAFILPDVHSQIQGSAVGLILPEDADASVYDLLDDILHGIVQRVPEPKIEARAGRARRATGPEPRSAFSQGIVRGAQFISYGLVKGAERAGALMNYGTPKIMNKLTPEPNPTILNPTVSKGLTIARDVSGTAVQITGFVASRIGYATMALGRYLAPHIQKQGTKLLSGTCNMSEQEASKKVGSVLEVAAGAVEGFGTVYEGLERSAGILASSLANNTVKIVQHKYGTSAGAATGDTLYTVGNMFTAGSNIRHLTPKGIAKTTAKETGKAFVEDYRVSLRGTSNLSNQFGGSNPYSNQLGGGNFTAGSHVNQFGAGPSSEVD